MSDTKKYKQSKQTFRDGEEVTLIVQGTLHLNEYGENYVTSPNGDEWWLIEGDGSVLVKRG